METMSAVNQSIGNPVGLSIGKHQANVTRPAAAGPGLSLAAKDPIELGRAIDNLPEMERLVLSLHFYEELDFSEIGMILNLKRSKISRLLDQAMYNLATSCPHS